MRIRISPIVIDIEEVTPQYLFRLGQLTVPFSRTLYLMFTLPDDSQVAFTIATTGKDARGNPTKLTGTPQVSVSDPKILTIVQPNPATPTNILSGLIQAAGPLGTAQVKVTDSEGGTDLVVLVDVEVVPGSAVSLDGITFGETTKLPPATVNPVSPP